MEAAYPLSEADQDPTLGLSDYLAIVNRRKFHFAGGFILVLAVAVAVVFALPPIYRSTASILIESQQIPTELVRSTITSYADERIEFVRQKVLTRSNILEVIDKYGLYREDRDTLTPSALVDRFRASTNVRLIGANSGRDRQTISFDLSFDDPSPKTAQLVANELVTRFLNENARSRAARAAETTQFLAGEGGRILESIQRTENRIAEFKLENSNRMPEVFQMNLSMLERLEREHQSVSANIEGLTSDLRMLELQLAQYQSASGGSASGPRTLPALQREYTLMLQGLSPEHPDARRLAREIEALKQAGAESAGEEPEATGDTRMGDPAYAALARQIESTRTRLAYLQQSKVALTEEIQALSERIAATPMVEKEYTDLQRDLQNLQAKYREMRNKEMEARIAQNLEEERKGERFSLLEPPIVPTEPAKPDRMKLLLVAGFLALGAGGGLVVLLELLDPALRGQRAFVRELGVTPLVAIPYISTVADAEHARHRRYRWLAAAAGAAIALPIAVHFLYMELDVLWYVMLRRLSTF